MNFSYCKCDSSAGTVLDYDALLRTSFRRDDFIAHMLSLIVTRIVTNCAMIVSQICLFVKQKVKIRIFHIRLVSLFAVLIKVMIGPDSSAGRVSTPGNRRSRVRSQAATY